MEENIFNTIHPRLIEATRNGPLIEWNERLGLIAKKIGLPVERIDWCGSPFIVAMNMLREVKACGPKHIEDLKAYLDSINV